jgi:hypothetical protein
MAAFLPKKETTLSVFLSDLCGEKRLFFSLVLVVMAKTKRKGRQGLPRDVWISQQKSRCRYFAGAGAAGMGGAGASGAGGVVCVSGFTPSMIELLVLAVVNARVSEVIMKMTAAPVVSLDRKLCAPRGPKTVLEAPPKAAPISAPLPFCKRTMDIKIAETIT